MTGWSAAGEVFKGRRADASVHPDHRGRGIGTWLADWLEECARASGSKLVGQTVPGDTDPERFFQARGYRPGWTSWVLQVPADRTIEPQPLPEGYTLREFAGPADGRVAFQLIEDAFNEWPDRDPSSFEDWAPRGPLRPGFEPWQIRFVVDPQGTEVGVCYTILAGGTGYVDAIAVRRDQRGLGLARALLVDAFERARDHGATVSELVDRLTHRRPRASTSTSACRSPRPGALDDRPVMRSPAPRRSVRGKPPGRRAHEQ